MPGVSEEALETEAKTIDLQYSDLMKIFTEKDSYISQRCNFYSI